MIKSIIFFFVLVFLSSLNAQQFTDWQNHTNLKDVRDVQILNTDLWAVSGGGAFKYSTVDHTFKTLVKSDGLVGISLSAITNDNNGKIWLGSSDGVINVYDPSSGNIKAILDIFNTEQTNKKINNLEVTDNDTIIASTDFGVSLIDADSYLFFDTFSKFGNFSPFTRVNYAIKSGLIYVATDEGVAIQKPGATNLSAPESWNVYQTTEGLPSDKVYKVAKIGNEIIAATEKGMAIFSNGVWQQFIPELSNQITTDFAPLNNDLFIISRRTIFKYSSGILDTFYTSSDSLKNLDVQNGIGIIAASNTGLLYHNLINSVTTLLPNGPAANQFPSLSTSSDGKLWSASGKDGAGVGFYTYDGNEWENFNTSNTPALPRNDVYYVVGTSENTAYIGTWGSGALEVSNGEYRVFNRQNSGIQGIPENPDFLVITGFAKDSKGNLWILNHSAANKKNLSMLTPDNNWHHYNVPVIGSYPITYVRDLRTDQYDTKWFFTPEGKPGVYYFNENKTYTDSSDDISGYVTVNDGLNSNNISSLVVDTRGDIWVGSTAGINIISNVGGVFSSGKSSLNITSVFTVRQQSVTAIAVDPLNQKWVGTTEGLLLLNSDGSRLLASFTSTNSALLSDNIESIAIDAKNGIVYVGTEQGLTSFETPYLKPLESFDNLFVYPNPFIVNDKSKLLVIDGLIKDCDIKILSITGNLVTEFSSPGGRTAYWDGTDQQGNVVNSGVYIIVAFDQEGNSVTTGKVAVLRE